MCRAVKHLVEAFSLFVVFLVVVSWEKTHAANNKKTDEFKSVFYIFRASTACFDSTPGFSQQVHQVPPLDVVTL